MNAPIYDQIGINYALKRQTEPRIATQIWNELKGAGKILNIGAGAGSYEPHEGDLIALEPSSKMIAQRSKHADPVVQGYAESLPFEDKSFSHCMTILSMHHWKDRYKAFKEIKRVTEEKFIALSWDPYANDFWLTRDYFPEIVEMDKLIFPEKEEFDAFFDNVRIERIMIPHDCRDGFLAAYWKKPEAYLEPSVRNSISTFSKISKLEDGLLKLKKDLESGEWERKNQEVLHQNEIDAGYILISARIPS
ncbi:MAG: methyltransferase domain-containing protein [Bacteroidota bacterium]